MSTSINYGDTGQFPPFETKAAIVAALADHDNEWKTNPYELLARIANTDMTGLPDGATTDLQALMGGGRL